MKTWPRGCGACRGSRPSTSRSPASGTAGRSRRAPGGGSAGSGPPCRRRRGRAEGARAGGRRPASSWVGGSLRRGGGGGAGDGDAEADLVGGVVGEDGVAVGGGGVGREEHR